MKLDPQLLKEDESRSNPMVVAMVHPDCPINQVCFGIVVGFGTVNSQCEFAKVDGQTLECLQPVIEIVSP